ncbi:MAG: (d)CMP kinase [Acidimicrobiia bacterium]|nr:(d)CMP kinase [Acidimicrobiia bacterium]
MSAGAGRWRGVIAIDGPAASGKSTLARRLAAELGLAWLDTGAFYRAAALSVIRAGEDFDDEEGAVGVVRRRVISQEGGRTFLDGEDVETEIRTPRVTEAASRVAALPGVREIMVRSQRRWVRERGGSAVVEGRDIGSVVFPDAPVKVYLTAEAGERARRRLAELGSDPEAPAVPESLARRDRTDSNRTASPLRRVQDAVEINTTDLNADQAVAEVLGLVRAARADPMRVTGSSSGPSPGIGRWML